MEAVLLIFARTVQLTLDLVYFAMLVRMILPIFADVEESRIYAVTLCISEPFIAPVRALLYKLNIGQSSPIDWSFLVTALIIVAVQSLLPAI